MITIRIEDAAGATRGRPDYPIDVWFSEIGPDHTAVLGKAESGAFKGDFLREEIGGDFEIYEEPYPAEVTS